ncbi:MAG: hypothetical protein Q8M19_20715 [Reyranella sp.]|nr:hypothetical protein [Reyranella sp.]
MGVGRLALVLSILWGGVAEAQQLDFSRVTRSGDERLSYRWRDLDRREQVTAFTLARQDIRDAEASFKDFSLDGMWDDIAANLRDETARFGNGARIEVRRTGDRLSWTVRAGDLASQETLIKALNERFVRSQKAYLARHLRQRLDEGRIMVDFVAATRALQEPMRTVAEALGATAGVAADDRARVNLALAFFQQVPYAALGDGGRRGGDFLPGPALLAQNRGDCDSKTVALAAVLRTYVPWRKLAVIVMPGHAVLGVDLPAKAGERTVRAQARQYVALEPAGPGMAPIGDVAPQTAKYLAQARAIEIWPLN